MLWNCEFVPQETEGINVEIINNLQIPQTVTVNYQPSSWVIYTSYTLSWSKRKDFSVRSNSPIYFTYSYKVPIGFDDYKDIPYIAEYLPTAPSKILLANLNWRKKELHTTYFI